MKTVLTRLAATSVIALVLLASACIDDSLTGPGSGSGPIPVAQPDPPDEVVKR